MGNNKDKYSDGIVIMYMFFGFIIFYALLTVGPKILVLAPLALAWQALTSVVIVLVLWSPVFLGIKLYNWYRVKRGRHPL